MGTKNRVITCRISDDDVIKLDELYGKTAGQIPGITKSQFYRNQLLYDGGQAILHTLHLEMRKMRVELNLALKRQKIRPGEDTAYLTGLLEKNIEMISHTDKEMKGLYDYGGNRFGEH